MTLRHLSRLWSGGWLFMLGHPLRRSLRVRGLLAFGLFAVLWAWIAPPASSELSNARVQLVSYGNTEVVIDVQSESAGYVVLNDVWHPWWTATVNNEDVDILKANVLFRAVQVEPGKSIVRFSFKPLDGAIAELRDRVLGSDIEAPAVVSMVP